MCTCRRVYKESYGNHRPFCFGVCLVAHTGWENLTPVSLTLILAPAFCWFWFLMEEINERLSPAFSILVGLTILSSLVLLFTTMFTEPGILPTITYEEYTEGNPDIPVRIVSKILLDGREFDLKQFRAKFSRYTANCIESFDHYCPWVGNAIGKRNYRYFVFFMFSSLLLAILVSISCTMLLVVKSTQDHTSFVDSMEDSVAATLLAVYGYCMTFSLIGLCGFHVKAVASNTTTNEILKGVYSTGLNPHDKGCYKNCSSFLCAPIPRSRVAEYDVESPLLQDVSRSVVSSSTDNNLDEDERSQLSQPYQEQSNDSGDV